MDSSRHVISAKIAEGRLPRSTPEHAALGAGGGRLCSGCDLPVLASNVQVDVQATPDVLLRFHLDCFGIWRVAARHAVGHRAAIDRERLSTGAVAPAGRGRRIA
jgi:hypothetical protein